MQNANGTRKGGGGDWGGSGPGAERLFHAESTEGRGLSRWAPARSGRLIDREDRSTHKRPLASASLVIGRPTRSMPRHARPTGDACADFVVRCFPSLIQLKGHRPGREVAETGEGAGRARRGYFTQSPQRAEATLLRNEPQGQRGGGPRDARHGSRGGARTNGRCDGRHSYAHLLSIHVPARRAGSHAGQGALTLCELCVKSSQ